jgi:DNA-3-methyladenine glycosylase
MTPLNTQNISISTSFYTRPDVSQIAQDLLGKYLVTAFDGAVTAGKIVETEAYRGPDDKASHAWNYRRTARTEVMYAPGGVAYVYLCYGIHHLFNVVTAGENEPHAVLIRAVEPVENLELMLHRRKKTRLDASLTNGPGALAQALGIQTKHSGSSLLSPDSLIWIEDRGDNIIPENIIASPRVGVGYAGECALWDWRFRVKDSPWAGK